MVRQSDKQSGKIVAWFLRWRGLAAMIWGAAGSILTALFMRFFLVSQLQAQAIRITALETQQAVIAARLGLIEQNQVLQLRSTCLDRSIGQQQMIGLTCPSDLHRGMQP